MQAFQGPLNSCRSNYNHNHFDHVGFWCPKYNKKNEKKEEKIKENFSTCYFKNRGFNSWKHEWYVWHNNGLKQ
jgi:hypothetical protein